MSAPAGAPRDPRPSAVSMRALLAAGVAATAVSTPPARERALEGGEPEGAGAAATVAPEGVAGGASEEAAPESEAA
ncbi:hypothetical protein [Streptomyces sp. ISL-94]|uniref:hypothetical protein n=1 Tax=Streptomyces sp. ISL-94 TaxID=2819190 RepID=UPI001BE54D70|nr:hypothetical protein [Streptomyces sp. ISL-94]MBT2479208.1 hypothetical protein [Streptomyces sp. ISL-94]